MPHWVPAIVSLIKRMILWFAAYLPQPSLTETNGLIQHPGEMQQKQHGTPGSKRKRKKRRNPEKNLLEKAEAPSGESQSKIKELELQPAELKLKQQEELVPQQETKSRPCEEPMEKNLRSELEEKIGRLQETVAALKDKFARQSKVVQDLKAELAFLKPLQPLGMEKEVPSFESEEKSSDMLASARTKPNNSEDENKSVEEGLKKLYQPFSRKNSISSEASVPLQDLSGAVAEGRQPLSDAKDATTTTQIDKDINKKPADIEGIFLPNHDLELRQLLSDANNAQITNQLDKKIQPNLDEAALSGGLSKSKYSFSTLLRALCIIELEQPNNSDIDNLEWLKRHHLSKFRQDSGRKWLKENLEPRKAEVRLNILEKAATNWGGNAGRLLVPLYKLFVRTNNQVHPTLDLDKVLLDSKERTYTSDGEDLGEVVQLLAGELKKKT